MRLAPKPIPGVTTPVRGGMAVLKPFNPTAHTPDNYLFTRWLANLPWWTPLLVLAAMVLWPVLAYAQSKFGTADAFGALWRWMPFLLWSGFLFNVLISVLAMLVGTVAGAALGLAQISLLKPVRMLAWFITQLFRNSPWLVILFIVLLALPFEIQIFGMIIRIPGKILFTNSCSHTPSEKI